MRRSYNIVFIIIVGACRYGFDLSGVSGDGAADTDVRPTADGTPGLADAAMELDAPVVLGPWSAPTPIASLDDGYSYDDPTLTDDLLEIYFNAVRPENLGGADIWRATRSAPDAAWEAPSLVLELSSVGADNTPEISSDGLTIFIARTVAGNEDIFVSTRPDRGAPWSTPAPVAELNTPAGDSAASVRSDLVELVFSSTRDVADRDLYLATRADPQRQWLPPQPLTAVNSSSLEGSPFLDATGRTLYFHRDINLNGERDLYVATRPTVADPFGPPTVIGELASAQDESDPWVSSDGRYMVFTYDTGGNPRLFETYRNP